MTTQLSFPSRLMLPQARAAADVAVERAGDAADRKVAGWCELACEALRQFARNQSGMWTIELARLSFEKSLPAPSDRRAWGKVVRMADSRGFIERVPGQFFAAASSHGSAKPVWKKGPQA